MSNLASQKDLLDQIWHSTRNSIGKDLLTDSKLVPVPNLSWANDFDFFSVFVKGKSVSVLNTQLVELSFGDKWEIFFLQGKRWPEDKRFVGGSKLSCDWTCFPSHSAGKN